MAFGLSLFVLRPTFLGVPVSGRYFISLRLFLDNIVLDVIHGNACNDRRSESKDGKMKNKW